MKALLFAFAAALALGACQSSPSKPQVPANLPPEENAAPRADSTGAR